MLEIKNLTKKYGDFVALDNINLTLTNGVYGILGANGAGKSTMLNLITDNIKRTSGEILYNGEDILTLKSAFRKKVGYTPQLQGMYESFSAYSFLAYIGALKGMKKSECKKQIYEYTQLVNLSDVIHKKLGSFSGGMRQRVLLAAAMLDNPEILILDEPTAGLDPEERIRLRNYIAKLSENRIVLLATHVVSDIECIASKVLILSKGKLLKTLPPIELISSLEGKVGEMAGSFDEVESKREQLGFGQIAQKKDGFVLRIVSDTLPEGFTSVDDIDLEDVYLYYSKEKGNKVCVN